MTFFRATQRLAQTANPTMLGKRVTRRQKAFTLIELIVVMAVIALLIAIAAPKYFNGLKKAKEAVLREDLSEMRKAIDHYHADKNKYPVNLQALVDEAYLKFIPQDPITESTASWEQIMLADTTALPQLYDVRSGAQALASDGSAYASW